MTPTPLAQAAELALEALRRCRFDSLNMKLADMVLCGKAIDDLGAALAAQAVAVAEPSEREKFMQSMLRDAQEVAAKYGWQMVQMDAALRWMMREAKTVNATMMSRAGVGVFDLRAISEADEALASADPVAMTSDSVIPAETKLLMLNKLAVQRGFESVAKALASLPRKLDWPAQDTSPPAQAPAEVAPSRHEIALRNIVSKKPVYESPSKASGSPERVRCYHCGHAWQPGNKPQQGPDCAYIEAMSALATPQPQPPSLEQTVPWPVVERYSGGAAKVRAVWVRFGDGPETEEFHAAPEQADARREDRAMLDWLDVRSNDMLLEFGFEIDGGVYLRIDAPGSEGVDIREKNSAREAIRAAMNATTGADHAA